MISNHVALEHFTCFQHDHHQWMYKQNKYKFYSNICFSFLFEVCEWKSKGTKEKMWKRKMRSANLRWNSLWAKTLSMTNWSWRLKRFISLKQAQQLFIGKVSVSKMSLVNSYYMLGSYIWTLSHFENNCNVFYLC